MADDDTPDEHEHDDDTPELPPEQEQRIVDKVISAVKDGLKEIVGAGGGDSGARTPPAPATPAATEAEMERQVKAGVEKEITSRERRSAAAEARRVHDEQHERLTAQLEKPPKTFSRLTSALWGDDDS